MNHLYEQMNIEKIASRYERKICNFPLLNTGQIDESRLRDQVRVALRNDAPSNLVGDIFSRPTRHWHGSYMSSSKHPTYSFPHVHESVVNPLINDFTVNGPQYLKPLTAPNGWNPPQEHPKIPLLPIKQLPKVDISLLRKQHRLVQLSHAAVCTNDDEKDGPCRKSRHCAKLKKLWSHLSVCYNDKCKVQHCFSSRYILGHYCRCKDIKCVVCEPARRQTKKYHEHHLPDTNLPMTKMLTTTISESDNLTKDSSSERHLPREDNDSQDPSKYLDEGGNAIYITNLKAFASNDVPVDTFSTKRHSLSSVSALSPATGVKTVHFEPNDALDVAFFLSRLKKQDS